MFWHSYKTKTRSASHTRRNPTPSTPAQPTWPPRNVQQHQTTPSDCANDDNRARHVRTSGPRRPHLSPSCAYAGGCGWTTRTSAPWLALVLYHGLDWRSSLWRGRGSAHVACASASGRCANGGRSTPTKAERLSLSLCSIRTSDKVGIHVCVCAWFRDVGATCGRRVHCRGVDVAGADRKSDDCFQCRIRLIVCVFYRIEVCMKIMEDYIDE